MTSIGTKAVHNAAKKLRSRQASLLRKAEELHLLHNVQVLVLVYHPGKDQFMQYCSCEAQELFFKKARAEEAGEAAEGSRETVRVRSDDLSAGPNQPMPPSSPSSTPPCLSTQSPKQPRDRSFSYPHKQPCKRPALSAYSGELAGLSTVGSTNGESTREAAPPWGEERQFPSEDSRKSEKTAEIAVWTDSDSSSLADLLLDPF